MAKVTIELDEEDARSYELFCKHLESWEIMDKAKVFEVMHGTVTMSFKETPGKIMAIKGDLPLYFRSKVS